MIKYKKIWLISSIFQSVQTVFGEFYACIYANATWIGFAIGSLVTASVCQDCEVQSKPIKLITHSRFITHREKKNDFSCTEICENGKYGTGCSQDCSCEQNESCDHVTGSCFDFTTSEITNWRDNGIVQISTATFPSAINPSDTIKSTIENTHANLYDFSDTTIKFGKFETFSNKKNYFISLMQFNGFQTIEERIIKMFQIPLSKLP